MVQSLLGERVATTERAARYLTHIVDEQEVPLYQERKRKSRKSKAKALGEFIGSVVPVVTEAVLSKVMW